MTRLLLFFFLLQAFFTASAQNVRDRAIQELHAIPAKNTLKPGYWLIEGIPPENIEVIQSRAENLKIVFIPTNMSLQENTQVYQINNSWKLAPGIHPDEDRGDFVVTIRDEKKIQFFTENFKHAQRLSHNSILLQNVRPAEIIELADVIFLNRYYKPAEESLLSYSNRALNRVLAFQTQYPEIKGMGQVISIKERGYDLNDPDIRGRSIFEWPDIGNSSHATDMATIAAGSGLISDGSTGSAPEALLKQASFNSLFAESIDYYLDVSVQNHSYGTTPESFYGPEAASYDASVISNPQLIHVFSIGNAGLETVESGPYEGITGFSTLTGNFKNAKNILTVSSSDAEGNVILQNSQGPTFDGRIKPEIVAYGEGGTSDAAALVSGSVAALSELFVDQYGQRPEFALMRAILIAGADELGTAGPDYATGYGQMNLANSARIISQGTFSAVSSGQTLNLDIPSGTASVRLVLSWMEPAALPGDTKLLANDLDLTVTDPNGTNFLPWTLSTYAHPDSLQRPARRGADHNNTQELITLMNPAPGRYELNITGPSNTLPAYLAWQIELNDQFEWRFPLSSSSMEAGRNTTVYWDTGLTGDARLEWSADASHWNDLGPLQIENEYFNFNVPDTTTVIRLRMSSNGQYYESMPFAVSPTVKPIIEFICPESWQMSWEPIENISFYRILGRKNDRLTSLATESATRYSMLFTDYPDSLVAIQPYVDGYPAQRSVTINIRQQGVGCYFASFTGLLQSNQIDLKLRIGTTLGISNIQTTRLNDGQLIFNTSRPALDEEFSDPSPLTGTNYYQTIITLENGQLVNSEIISFIYAPPGDALVYPNPVASGGSLKVYSTDVDIFFELLTPQGGMVQRIALNTKLEEIPMTIARGFYLYRIIGPGIRTISGKLIVY